MKEITDEEFDFLMACLRTLNRYTCPRGICPKCGEYIILDGYVCFGCGYDRTKK